MDIITEEIYKMFDKVFGDRLLKQAIKYVVFDNKKDKLDNVKEVGFILTEDYNNKLESVTKKLFELAKYSIITSDENDIIKFYELDKEILKIFGHDQVVRIDPETHRIFDWNVYFVRNEGFILGKDLKSDGTYIGSEIFQVGSFKGDPGSKRRGIRDAFKELIPEVLTQDGFGIDYYLLKSLYLAKFNKDKLISKITNLVESVNYTLKNHNAISVNTLSKDICKFELYIKNSSLQEDDMFKLFIRDMKQVLSIHYEANSKKWRCEIEEFVKNINNYLGPNKNVVIDNKTKTINIKIVDKKFLKNRPYLIDTKFLAGKDIKPKFELCKDYEVDAEFQID